MAPIEEEKKRYIKAVKIVLVITVISLAIFFLFQEDMVRCYLKPINKESGWDDSSIALSHEKLYSEILGTTEAKTNTPTPTPRTEWDGLRKTTYKAGGQYSIEVFSLSFRSRLVIGGLILTVCVTMTAIAAALYYVIRSSQLHDPKALALSGAGLILALILGVFGSFKFWQWIRTESYVEPDSSYTKICIHAPIIYLYDEQCREATVKLNIDGELTCTYPTYRNGWTVKTSPDGTLTDENGRQYEYLFWEANLNMVPDTSHGFCVKGSDTATFLENALSDLGLSDKEANTFIMYWLPQMETNPYNVISFQTEAYENIAKLDVTPSPDTIVRVNMFFYSSDEYVEIEEQDLTSMNTSLDERKGFVLVEWGGETIE